MFARPARKEGTLRSSFLTIVSLVTVIALLAGPCCLCSNIPDIWNVGPAAGQPEEPPPPGTPQAEDPSDLVPPATPVNLEPLEVISERELSTKEFMSLAAGDAKFVDVYALAQEQGYADPKGGGEFILSDGSSIHSLVIAAPAQEQVVVALRFANGERNSSLLARVEIESQTVIIFDRSGGVRISERGFELLAASSPRSNAIVGSRPPGMMGPLLDCEGPGPHALSWENFDHCGRSYSGAAWGQILSCLSTGVGAAVGIAFASTAAAPFVITAAVVVLFAACRVPTVCVLAAAQDDPPTYDIRMPTELPEPCRTICRSRAGQEALAVIRNYRVQVHIDDDRRPRPETPREVDLCSGERQILRIRDCAGHQIDLPIDGPSSQDRDFTVCPAGQFCIQTGNTAHCGDREETGVSRAVGRFTYDPIVGDKIEEPNRIVLDFALGEQHAEGVHVDVAESYKLDSTVFKDPVTCIHVQTDAERVVFFTPGTRRLVGYVSVNMADCTPELSVPGSGTHKFYATVSDNGYIEGTVGDVEFMAEME